MKNKKRGSSFLGTDSNTQKRISLFTALGVVLFFGILTVFGQEGILKLRKLYQLKEQLRAENQVQAEINQSLRNQIVRFQRPAYIQQTIRERLGYVRPNEYILLLQEDTLNSPPVKN